MTYNKLKKLIAENTVMLIDGYDRYYVSIHGEVLSRSKNSEQIKYLYKTYSKQGYNTVNLYKNGKKKCFRVHRLVAQAFIPNTNNYPQVNHINEIKTDNRVDNLEWCTSEYNNNYGTKNERISKSLSRKVAQINQDGKIIKIWSSSVEAERHGYGSRHITACARGCEVTHLGYCWKYLSDIDECALERGKIDNPKRNHGLSKRVMQIDQNDNIVKIWESVNDAGRNGFQISHISSCCKNIRPRHKGFKWKYV